MKKVTAIVAIGLLAVRVAAAEPMQAKARAITLPNLEYRDTPLKAILNDIVEKSREADPEKAGVNLAINLDDALAGRKLTMAVSKPTVERALKVLGMTAGLAIRYESGVIIVEKAAEPR